jgi:hypothetical protein
MKSPRLTGTAGQYDLKLEDGKFVWVEDGSQAAQHALVRLLIFKGEIALDGMLTTKTELGTQWYEIIFDHTKELSEKELELKSRILGTPGVKNILSWDWSQSGKTVTIDASFQTEWGEASVGEEIELL